MALTHRFLLTCHDLRELLSGCNKLSTYCSRLEKQSTRSPNRYSPANYKGDGLELFAEALIKLSPVDNRIGIGNYQVVQKSKDYGVDGYGIGANGNPATVQVKYRSNRTLLLTANEIGDEEKNVSRLTNFTNTSFIEFKVKPEDNNNMLVITTAKGLHPVTSNEMFKGKVRCLGWEELRQLVDNNRLFWDRFRELCSVT